MARQAKISDDALIDLFLDMQAAERGAGKNTLDAYRNDLADLSAHLRAAARGIADATTDGLRGFLASLSERGFAASSLARRLSAVRQLYRFLYAEGKRGDDPAAVLEGPKRARALGPFEDRSGIIAAFSLRVEKAIELPHRRQPPCQRGGRKAAFGQAGEKSAQAVGGGVGDAAGGGAQMRAQVGEVVAIGIEGILAGAALGRLHVEEQVDQRVVGNFCLACHRFTPSTVNAAA